MEVNDLRSQIIFFVIFVDEYKVSAFYLNFKPNTACTKFGVTKCRILLPPPGPPPLNNSKAGQEGGYIPLRKP